MPLQPTWRWHALATRFMSALAVISIATASAIGYAFWFANEQIRRAHRVPIHLPQADSTKPANYLIVGSDSREFVGKDPTAAAHFGTQKNNDENLADVIMIAHVDPSAPGKGFLVSIPRDTWVPIAGHGSAKINSAFHYGAQTLVTTIENNFHFDINHYLKLDFATFADVVNAIGRVHIFFPAAAYDKTGLDITTPGCRALDGLDALAYRESREYHYKTADGYQLEGSADIGRIQRQQYFIRSLAQEAIKDGARNPLTAKALVEKIVPHLEVDNGMGLQAFFALVRAFRSVDPGAVRMVTVPTQEQRIHGQDAQVLESEQAAPIFARLGSFTSPSTPTTIPKIAPTEIRVQVLNGAGVKGIAGSAATALSTAGFASAGAAADADRSDYPLTLVRYTAGNVDKAHVVASYLGGVGVLTPVVETSTSASADVVVVVGRDFVAVAAPGSYPSATPSSSPTVTTASPNPGSTPGVTVPKTEPGRPAVGCG